MNIFFLDHNPIQAAKWNIDAHVRKIILEGNQMLCAAFPINTAPYKRAFYNHPVTKWVRQTEENYLWTIEHVYALCDEFKERYNKEHKSKQVTDWCFNNIDLLKLPKYKLTIFPMAMPDYCKINGDPVQSYRNYYIKEKYKIASWKQNKPEWWINI